MPAQDRPGNHPLRRIALLCGMIASLAGGTRPVPAQTLALDSLAAVDVGGTPGASSMTHQDGVVQMTAGGQGIGLKSDQFLFAAEPGTGDFDLRLRVASLKNTDLWAKAGLMLRDGLGAEARFAAVFATPSGAGCLFQSRETAGGMAAQQGHLPANPPLTWLRLRREGDVVTGYAGYDGQHWTLLGARTISFGTNAMLGLAVTSHATASTTSEFRDIGPAQNPVVRQVATGVEPLGPSTRRSPMVLSEIMYHPADRPDGRNLEFVELYNSQPYFEDISGWKLAGDVEYQFPEGTVVPGGGFLVVAAVPEDVRQVHGLGEVFGPFSGRLSNGGGNLRLLGDRGAVFLDLEYTDEAPWPKLPDGTGHSLVLVRPSYGEADPRAWGASRVIGGSPGMTDAVDLNPITSIRLNEWQVAAAGIAGFVELFHAGSTEVDLGGLRLGTSPRNLPFTIPHGTRLKPGGLVAFSGTQLGFNLDPKGGALYLQDADRTRFLDAVTFAPQVAGTSAGRWPNGNPRIRSLSQPTPGGPNARPKSDLVINEIHHSPPSGNGDEEFIELHNAGSAAIDLGGWAFTSGVSYQFPPGTLLRAGGFLVVARNIAVLKQTHPSLDPALIVGPYDGKLDGRGEDLVLSRPTGSTGGGNNDPLMAPVATARYSGSGRWNRWSDEGGSTLELADPRADAAMPANWLDSDESNRGSWMTIEFTGLLDNGPTGGGFGGGPGGRGTVAPDSLHIILLGEGECLVDNVEVIGPGNTNRIANGTFEGGISGWTFSGNHVRSSLETGAGDDSGQSLHLRASGNGDTGANKIFTKLSRPLTNGNTATLRARVKWLRGWPEILLRLRGNYLEAYGRLDAPGGSGTPGAANSRSLANTGPAFGEVSHFPTVPATNEAVVVTALLDDPDGIGSVTLRYRVDPAREWTEVGMTDDGTGGDEVPGDGVHSATIPAPASPKLVAFTIDATDAAAAPMKRTFPPGAPESECLVRFGDGIQSGAFGTYRLWVTQANSDLWKNRPVMSNEPVEGTFVYGNSRAIHNAGGRFAGSPFHQQFLNGPASEAHFVIEFPRDDRVLGASSLNKLHAPGNGAFDDATLQREQVVYWLARQSGVPWLHRRFFHFYVNGTKKRTLMEDTQVGSDDLVEQFWPDDPDGNLYKLQPWFEFPDATTQTLQMQSSTFVSIDRFTTSGDQLKLARYRWNWLVRGAEGTANDYTNVLEFINVATAWNAPAYEARLETLIDLDEWFRFFAIHHAVGNWDSLGYRNQQNTYAYKPRNGRWELIPWDANIALGNSNSDGPTNLQLFNTSDPTLTRWFNQNPSLRRRFLTAYARLVNGPMQVDRIGPILDAKYAAFQEHGVTATSPAATRTWINAARNTILAQIAANTATFAVNEVAGEGTLTLSGTGPLDMAALQVNGAAVPVTWMSTRHWTASLAAPAPDQALILAALDAAGSVLPGTRVQMGPANLGALTLRIDGRDVVLECAVPLAGAYDLQGSETLGNTPWQTVATQSTSSDTVQFRIPVPSRPHTFYRVARP